MWFIGLNLLYRYWKIKLQCSCLFWHGYLMTWHNMITLTAFKVFSFDMGRRKTSDLLMQLSIVTTAAWKNNLGCPRINLWKRDTVKGFRQNFLCFFSSFFKKKRQMWWYDLKVSCENIVILIGPKYSIFPV